MKELFADVNGIKICYEIQGDGEPVILIHGFAMYKEFWFAQIPELSKQFKLITIDNRSAGKSDHPIESYEMDAFVEDVKGLMDYLKIKRAHIMGHSLGGMIAQNFALKYPDRLNKLVLIATLPKFPGDISGLEMYKNSQLSDYKAKLKVPIKAFYAKMKQRFTRQFFKLMVQDPKRNFHGIFTTEDLIEYEKKGTSTPQDIINQTNAIAKHNTLNRLCEIKNKTLILTGEKDRLIPKSMGIKMSEELPNSTLKILTGGHWFPLESAPEVNQAIIEFLSH
ncbi:MAG: alpha/beta fold hydrolase [Candidatus Thorarchaeota archaeon]